MKLAREIGHLRDFSIKFDKAKRDSLVANEQFLICLRSISFDRFHQKKIPYLGRSLNSFNNTPMNSDEIEMIDRSTD